MDANQNKRVAFYPECYGAPIELLAAFVPTGKVTERIWKEALSERLIELANQESNPSASTEWACRALDCPYTDDVDEIAQHLFESNYELKTFINLSVMDQDPNEYFPKEILENDEEALEAINETTLFDWVFHAAYFTGGNALDAFLRHEHEHPN